MPFTLSHAAAALPLRRLLPGIAVFPALVIGCFLPDVPYFLPDPLCDINAHQWPGLVGFGLPCGWLLYLLWQHFFVAPTLDLLPRHWSRRLAESNARSLAAATVGSISVSLLAGALSHIVWDAFTHLRGWGVQIFPALAQPLVTVDGRPLRICEFLQHASTVVGLAWIAVHLRRRRHEQGDGPTTPAPDADTRWTPLRRWLLLTAMTVASTWLTAIAFSRHAAAPLRWTAYNVACRGISSAALVAMLYALVWHGLRRARGAA